MNKKSNRMQIILLVLTGLSIVILLTNVFSFKNSNGKNPHDTGELFPVETYPNENGENPSDEFYAAYRRITKEHLLKFQTKKLGKTIRYIVECCDTVNYIQTEDTLCMTICADKAVLSDKSDIYTENDNSYVYLTLHYTSYNESEYPIVIHKYGNTELIYYDGNALDKSALNYWDELLICNADDMTIYATSDTPGVTRISPAAPYTFSENGDSSLVCVEPNTSVTWNMEIKIKKEKLEKKSDLMLLYHRYYTNNNYIIIIPYDEIENII